MQVLLKVYRLINILSLDIAAGAIVSSLFFAKIFEVQILPFGLAALGLAVWIVYTADHLRDAKTITGKAASSRHRFHQDYFSILVIALVIALSAEVVIIFFIRQQVLRWGLALGTTVGIYLMLHRYLKFLKEVFVALLYTTGVLLPSIAITKTELMLEHAGLMLQFAMVALANLLLFSWFDFDHDDRDAQRSFVTILGRTFTVLCIWSLLMLHFIIVILITSGHSASWILLAMNTTLLVIFIFRKQMQYNDRYRLLGDAVFLVPVFYWL